MSGRNATAGVTLAGTGVAMPSIRPRATYEQRRGEIETYFDRTAADAWKKLTSDAPVSGIRATVRAGRDAMRATLLDWLPANLSGRRLLDAGCGTGALAIEAARRGAQVVAVDLSGELVKHARLHLPRDVSPRAIDFRVGDMTDRGLGRFDHVVAMDSLIHYAPADMAQALARLAARTERSILFTFAPRTALLMAMHTVGRMFPRGDRSPSIVPVRPDRLLRLLAREPGLELWRAGRGRRIDRGFYKSQALELVSP